MNEITVYTCGNSRKITTWSNVPFLFTQALEAAGIKVNRVDISPSKHLNHLFNTLSYVLCKRILRLEACPEFHRTALHRWLIRRRLKRAARIYPNSQLNLFLSFAFTNPYSMRPNVLWCDWTDAIVIERLGRKPKWYERRALQYEFRVLQQADRVYTMFPDCKIDIEKRYGRPVLYLNRNVVNTVYRGPFEIEQNIQTRAASKIILFIGNSAYLDAAIKVAAAVTALRPKYKDLECHLIGIQESQLPNRGAGIYCHGYLNKDLPAQRELYYSLLLRARVLVNTTEKWAGFSALVEGMYYGCPVVVSPFSDFVATFGEQIPFGYYCNHQQDRLSDLLERMLTDSRYTQMARSAYEQVRDYTWDNYVAAFLKSLADQGLSEMASPNLEKRQDNEN